MTDATRTKIYSKLRIDLREYDTIIVEKVIMQVEALYSYSILRALVSSERNDPFIKNMMINFRVTSDSPALEIYKQPKRDKNELHNGIMQFRMNGIRSMLVKGSMMLSSAKYMALPKLLYGMTFDAMKGHEIFKDPIPVRMLLGYGPPSFR